MVNSRQRSLLNNARERAHSRRAVAQRGQVCGFVVVNYLLRDSCLKDFVTKRLKKKISLMVKKKKYGLTFIQLAGDTLHKAHLLAKIQLRLTKATFPFSYSRLMKC